MTLRWLYYKYLYRTVMELTHKFDCHYAPEIGPIEPDGKYQKWCKWCGLRYTYHKGYPTYIIGWTTTKATNDDPKAIPSTKIE